MKNFSIIIPCFNQYNFTKSCLNDLSHLPQDRAEIIIIDNGSKDDTKLLSNKDNIKYIRNDANEGFGKACNKGYSLSTNDNIMFLNNDIRVKSNHSNWIDNILNEIKNSQLISPTAGFVDPNNNFNFCYETNDIKKPINYMSGWMLCATRKTFDKLAITKNEIFSNEFFCYYEDTDLSFRATEVGIKFCLASVPVIHFGKVSSSQINTNKLYLESREIFNKKWANRK